MGPHCLPQRLLKHFSRREKQTTFVAIGALIFIFIPEESFYLIIWVSTINEPVHETSNNVPF